MTSNNQENAMTEIALAMAMGFFSIMVLTSMSVAVQTETQNQAATAATSTAISTAILVPQDQAGRPTSQLKDDDQLIIFDGKTFYNRDLSLVDPETVTQRSRVILAVAQDLSMAAVLSAQRRFKSAHVMVTPLTRDWQQAIGNLKNAR